MVNGANLKKSVDVMFLHDTHSHINSFNTVNNGKSTVLGGFSRIKTLINEQKEKNPDTLVVDAGDFSMGTLVQVLYEEQASELRMLGEIGVEVTTFGNHEFDYYADGLANMLNAALDSGDALPQLVVCNLSRDVIDQPSAEQKLLIDALNRYEVKDYIVLEKNGVKIAITGAFGQDCLDCVVDFPLIYNDPVESVKATVADIEANEAADMIICISHGGTSDNPEKSEDEILAQAVPELDLIISGHSHTKLDEPIVCGDTYIVSAKEYGKYLGSLSMSQKDDGSWKMDSYKLIKVDDSIEQDSAAQEKADRLMSVVDSKYLEQFGYTKDQILCENDIEFPDSSDTTKYHTEINLGSIMADAYTYSTEKANTGDTNPVDVAIVPSGTIRDTYAIGNITPENVFNSFSLGIGNDGVPGYPLISVYLTGKELKLVAEIDASVSDIMTTARLYTDGLYWSYNPNRMILNKATDVFLVNGNEERIEIEDDKLYRVVTDYYTSQMLGGVTELSYGLLSIVPKYADGTIIEDYADAVVMDNGKELKAWVAIAKYMESFEDTDGDGVGNVPEKYATEEGRKIVEDSKKIGDLLRNPNKFFFIIIAVVLLVILILVVIIILIVRLVKRIIRRKRK